MHVLLKDKSLKKFLEQEMGSGGAKIVPLHAREVSSSKELAQSGHPLVYFSIVSVVSLLLLIFMGLPMYILVGYEGDWQQTLKRSEVEFAKGVLPAQKSDIQKFH